MHERRIFYFGLFIFSALLNSTLADETRLDKFLAVQEMVGMVQREEAQFSVMLQRYFIEGREYFASLLSVSPAHTENMVQTNDGFEGLFLFPKEIIHQEAWVGNAVDDRVVRVKVKVRLDDIYMIIGWTRAGDQFSLYPN